MSATPSTARAQEHELLRYLMRVLEQAAERAPGWNPHERRRITGTARHVRSGSVLDGSVCAIRCRAPSCDAIRTGTFALIEPPDAALDDRSDRGSSIPDRHQLAIFHGHAKDRSTFRDEMCPPSMAHRLLLAYGHEVPMNVRSALQTVLPSVSHFSPLALCLSLAACQGEVPGAGAAEAAEDVAQAQLPIVDGETDREHTAVLAIAAIQPDGESLCTGTLIAPNLVLTARHCVVPVEQQEVDCNSSTFEEPFSPDALWVSPNTSLRGAELFPVLEVAVPDDDGALCGADIALLILDGQFSEQLEPYAPRLAEPAEQGEAFTAVGFGTALEQGQAGVRRSRTNIQVLCGAEQCGAPDVLKSTEFLGEEGACEGDSGGPALDADGQVLGVASRTGQDCTWAIYSAVAPWQDWIIGVATHAESLGDYATQGWLAAATDTDVSGGLGVPDVDAIGDAVTPDVEGEAAAPLPDLSPGATIPSNSSGNSGCALAPAPGNAGFAGSFWWLAAGALGLVGRWRRRG